MDFSSGIVGVEQSLVAPRILQADMNRAHPVIDCLGQPLPAQILPAPVKVLSLKHAIRLTGSLGKSDTETALLLLKFGQRPSDQAGFSGGNAANDGNEYVGHG